MIFLAAHVQSRSPRTLLETAPIYDRDDFDLAGLSQAADISPLHTARS